MITLLIRILIIYVFVILSMRVMGKREIGELQPYELVVSIIISELAATPLSDAGIPLLYGIIPIMGLTLLHFGTALLSLKSESFRALVSGRPSMLIEQGRILYDELLKSNFNMNDLIEQLRLKDATLADVHYAILETNGELSVLLNKDAQNITRKDLQMEGEEPSMPLSLVLDGKINNANMELISHDLPWLCSILSKLQMPYYKDMLYVAFDPHKGEWIYQPRTQGVAVQSTLLPETKETSA